jgi:hypothetical protein
MKLCPVGDHVILSMRAIRLIPLAELSNRLNLMIAIEPGSLGGRPLGRHRQPHHLDGHAHRHATGEDDHQDRACPRPDEDRHRDRARAPAARSVSYRKVVGYRQRGNADVQRPCQRGLHRVLELLRNVDNSFGSSSATNFSISPTDRNAFEGDLPNDIATSGSGSTEITGVTAGHPESFNVQAAGQWTIKVVAAR